MAPPKPKTAPSAADAPAAGDVQASAPPTAPTDWPPDEFTGLGGDYVRDPVTGVRTRVPPPAPPEAPATDPAPAAP